MKTLLVVGVLVGCSLQALAAAPLGLEIGSASCADARGVLGASNEKAIGQDLLLTAQRPGQTYPGATKVLVRCSADRVIAVQLEMTKGGMGNGNARATYATLKKKYKQVAGGPMPSLGDGYARFVAGNTVIEQDASHLRFEFTVTYYTSALYERLREADRRSEQETKEKKEQAL